MKFSELKRKLKTKKKDRWLNAFDFKILKVTIRIQWNSFFFQNEIFIFMVYIRTHPEELIFVKDLYHVPIWYKQSNLMDFFHNPWKNFHILEFTKVDIWSFFGRRDKEFFGMSSYKKFYSTYHIDFIDFNFEDF